MFFKDLLDIMFFSLSCLFYLLESKKLYLFYKMVIIYFD